MLVSALVLALVSPAQAWSVKRNSEGDALRWLQTPVPYQVNPENGQGLDEVEVEELVHTALDQWAAVQDVSLSFDFQGTTDRMAASYEDGVNTIYFEDEWPSDWDAGFLALTFTWSVDGGEIVAFDMAINESFDWTTHSARSGHDLSNALTHEIGHAVGMAHSEEGDATMFADSRAGDTAKRTLAQDDQEGLRYLYSGILDEGAWMCSAGGSPGGAGLGLLFVFGAVGLRRRSSEAEQCS